MRRQRVTVQLSDEAREELSVFFAVPATLIRGFELRGKLVEIVDGGRRKAETGDNALRDCLGRLLGKLYHVRNVGSSEQCCVAQTGDGAANIFDCDFVIVPESIGIQIEILLSALGTDPGAGEHLTLTRDCGLECSGPVAVLLDGLGPEDDRVHPFQSVEQSLNRRVLGCISTRKDGDIPITMRMHGTACTGAVQDDGFDSGICLHHLCRRVADVFYRHRFHRLEDFVHYATDIIVRMGARCKLSVSSSRRASPTCVWS